MRIKEYNQMMKYLTRPKEEKPILRYIRRMNELYNSGGSVEVPHETDPGYVSPEEMIDIKKTLNVSPMVKKPKKQIKKTLIVEKPRPVKPPIIDYLELQDWLNEIDSNTWTEEESKEEVLLRVPRRKLAGIASLLDVG